MSSINELITREDLLYENCKKYIENPVRDGIVNPPVWETTNPKIVFVLKEANDFSGDLRELLSNPADYPDNKIAHTWKNIARWAKGLTEPDLKDIDWEDIDRFENWRDELHKICAINVSKASGGSSTDQKQLLLKLRDNESRDFTLLKNQLELYADETMLIILCGTDVYYKVLYGENCTDNRTTRGIYWGRNSNNQVIINYWHPNARFPARFLHYSLIDAYREIISTHK